MLKHRYKEGQAIAVLKTDLENNNPALRDWVCFRIVDKPHHPLVRNKHVWPTLNFSSAIDDHDFSVTHVLRGNDLKDSEDKQGFIYEYLKWKMPETTYYGQFTLGDIEMSKSVIKKGIEEHYYQGWDDPRIGTLRALKRRGFQAQAIVNLIKYIGPKPQDINISTENLSAFNRREIDFSANRYYFVSNPVKIHVDNPGKKGTVRLPLHPEDSKRGFRKLSVSSTFYVSRDDFEKFKGFEVRLKGLYNIKLGNKAWFTSKEVKNIPKIQWVPMKYITVNVMMPDRSIIKGFGELGIGKLKVDDVIQFERFGFVRVDSVSKNKVVVYFAHQ